MEYVNSIQSTFSVLTCLVKRFQRLTNTYLYCLFVILIPLISSLIVGYYTNPKYNNQTTNTLHNDKTDKKYTAFADACHMVWIDGPLDYSSHLIQAYISYYDLPSNKIITIINKQTFTHLKNHHFPNVDDNIIIFEGCIFTNVVRLMMRVTQSRFSVSMENHLFGNRIQLFSIFNKYIWKMKQMNHTRKNDFVQLVWNVMQVEYGVRSNLNITINSNEQFLQENPFNRRAFFRIIFYCAIIFVMYQHNSDIKNGFTLHVLSNRTLIINYIISQWLWCVTYGLHFLWWILLIVVKMVINPTKWEFHVATFASLVFQSLDLTLTSILYVVLIKNRLLSMVTFVTFNLITFVIAYSYINNAFKYDSYNEYIMQAIISFIPGILGASIYHQTKVTNGSKFLYLFSWYLVVIIIKFIACYLLMVIQYRVNSFGIAYDKSMKNVIENVNLNDFEPIDGLKVIKLDKVRKRLSSTRVVTINRMEIGCSKISVLYSSDRNANMETVCRLVTQHVKPDNGNIEIVPSIGHRKTIISLVPTANVSFSELSVKEYLELFCKLKCINSKVQFQMIHKTVKLLNMIDIVDMCTTNLKRQVIVLDNPSKEIIDFDERRSFWSILSRMRSTGRTIFMTTDSIEEVDYIADYVYILLPNGSVIEGGTPNELKLSHLSEAYSIRIAKTSKMKRQAILDYIVRDGRVCQLQTETAEEYVFAFKFETIEQRRIILKLLDELHAIDNGATTGKIVVNSISRNTIHDAMEKLLISHYDCQPIQISQLTVQKLTNKLPSESFLSYLYFRFNITFIHPPTQLILYIYIFLILYLIIDFFYYVVFNMAIVKTSLVFDLNTVFPIFDDKLTKNGSDYNVQVTYSSKSVFPNLFLMLNELKKYARKELEKKDIKFDLMVNYVGHDPSRIDVLQKTMMLILINELWIVLIPPIIILTLSLFIKRNEFHLASLIQANCTSMFPYFFACQIASLLFYIIAVISSLILFPLIQWTSFNPIVNWTNFETMLYAIIRFTFIMILFDINYDIFMAWYKFKYSKLLAIQLYITITTIIFKLISMVISITDIEFNDIIYTIVNVVLTISPIGLVISEMERILVQDQRNFTEDMNKFKSNVLKHHAIFWDTINWQLIVLFGYIVFYFMIICMQQHWKLLYYKLFENRTTIQRRISKPDVSVTSEHQRVLKELKLVSKFANESLVVNSKSLSSSSSSSSSKESSKIHLIVYDVCMNSNTNRLLDISFTVNRGSCLAFYGLPGCGKTELLEIIAGIRPYDSGKIIVNGQHNRLDDKKSSYPRYINIENLSYCPSKNFPFYDIPVQVILTFFARKRGIPSNIIAVEIQQICQTFHLTHLINQVGNRLSNYESRRLMLASAFIGRPSIVVLDEPTVYVDLTRRREIWNMINAVRRMYHPTILLSTQFSNEVDAISDRMTLMTKGMFCFIGTHHKARRQLAKSVHIYIKAKPMMMRDIQYMVNLRRHISSNFANILLTFGHKYVLNYYIANPTITWSVMFERLEELRELFELETFTLNIAKLDHIFFEHMNVGKQNDQQTMTGGGTVGADLSIVSTDTLLH
ncbi:hypothetical protein BLOT_006692 [Blomia tropicalis]|nr:hypothetical protein BLOT_006692 [Blomia tropicalis]